MEPRDLTVEILREIRTEIRANREVSEGIAEGLRASNEMHAQRFAVVDARFEVIETALRDMSEQLVMHSRALRTLLDRTEGRDGRVEDLERRVTALEASQPGA